MKDVIEGRVWTLGPDVDTDQIISGKYLTIIDPEELKKHVFEIALPEFAKEARAGDIIVADENFACGSSREHAPQAMRAIGVGAVVADSFARIFYRNAINLRYPNDRGSRGAGDLREGRYRPDRNDRGSGNEPADRRLRFVPAPSAPSPRPP